MSYEPGRSIGVKRSRNGNDDEAMQHSAKKGIVKTFWARNHSEGVELNFNWVVENFSILPQGIDEEICSPEFSSDSDMNRWRLKLYPKGQHSCQGFIAVHLARGVTVKKMPPVPTMFEITLLNSKNDVLTSNKFHAKMFDNDNKSYGIGLLKLEDVFSKGGLLHPTDELHIRCQVRYENKKNVYTQSVSQVSITSAPTAAANLTKRFEHLFNEGMEFSDMEIRVRGVTFLAHKVVLATGSPVFAAMLQAKGFTENKTNILKIDDLEPPVVKEMLRFLYTDRVENMDELAKELLVVADRYLIDLLRSECQSFLAQRVTVENCCQLLALADSHSAADLKTVTMSFLMQHTGEVSATVGWKALKQTHPHLGFQLIEANIRIEPSPSVIKHELDASTVSSSRIELTRRGFVLESDSDESSWMMRAIDPPPVVATLSRLPGAARVTRVSRSVPAHRPL